MVIAGLFGNAQVAAGFGSFLFFVLQFFAGLWSQRPDMPTWLRDISDYTPRRRVRASVDRLERRTLARALHLIVLAVWGAMSSRLAIRFFNWE